MNKKRLILFLSLASATWMLPAQSTLKIGNFEDGTDCFTLSSGNKITRTIVSNPYPDDVNKSSKVLKLDYPADPNGLAVARDGGSVISGPTTFIVGEGAGQYRYVHLKIRKSFTSTMQWQFRNNSGTGRGYANFSNTVANGWQYIVIDLMNSSYSNYASLNETFAGFLIWFDHNKSHASTGFTAYIDDIYLSNFSGEIIPVLNMVNNLYTLRNNKILSLNGKIGIGLDNPTYPLEVNGTIRAREVKIENTNWPDYVFSGDYKLPTLHDVSRHIEENRHLPGIPSSEEVAKEGINLSEMNARLLRKIEEMTLYMIQQQKEIDELKNKIKQLESR
jgi:hypothetical protein